MKIAYYTLGCKVNQYETEKLRTLFEKQGSFTVPFSEKADVYIINTCTVTSVADGKSRAVIRKAKKTNPDSFVIVTGCYSQTHREDVENIEECDLVVDIKDKLKIPEIIKEKNIQTEENIKEISCIPSLRMRTRAVVKVQDGCSQFCSYCLIPFARSYKSSVSINDVTEEVKELCDNNYKEIVLTGIRLGSYNDEEKNLSCLIENLLEKTSIERIRLSSIEMWEIDEKLIDLMENSRMCNHLHIPLQNGNNEILKLMNRPYNREEYYALTEKIRERVPDLGLTTDVIVGFPNENEEYFQDSLEFIEKVGFSRIHIFPYSRRPGTKADKMDGHIDPQTKKERVARLSELGKKSTQVFCEKFIDKECEILFEIKKKDGFTYGYTRNYIEAKTQKNVERNQSVKLKPIKIEEGILIV